MPRPNVSQTLTDFYQRPIAQVSSELIFSILAIILFSVFAIRPTLLTMSDLIKELQDKEALNNALTEKIASLSSAQAIYTTNQDRLVFIDEAIPAAPKIDEALSIIEKIASENGLLISSLRAVEVPKEDSTATGSAEKTRVGKTISFSVQGDYPSIRSFVSGLQSTRRAIVVESVIFNLSDVQNQKILQAHITVQIQYYGNPL